MKLCGFRHPELICGNPYHRQRNHPVLGFSSLGKHRTKWEMSQHTMELITHFCVANFDTSSCHQFHAFKNLVWDFSYCNLIHIISPESNKIEEVDAETIPTHWELLSAHTQARAQNTWNFGHCLDHRVGIPPSSEGPSQASAILGQTNVCLPKSLFWLVQFNPTFVFWPLNCHVSRFNIYHLGWLNSMFCIFLLVNLATQIGYQ